MQVAERLGRDHLDRVRNRPQRPQRGEQVVRLSDGAEVDGVDHHEGLAAQVGGQIGGRREVHQPGGGGELLRQTGLGELAPSLQHLGGRLGGPPQQPGVDLGDRKQPQLDRGDHAEAAAAAAQRPEQVRLGAGVGAHDPAVGGDDLDRLDVVGRQPVGPAQPAHPAADCVADHADIGRGARQCRQAMLGRGLDDLDPDGAGLGPGNPRGGIDADLAHALGLDQDGVGQQAERRGVVAGALRGDPQPVRAGETDDLGDVLRAGGQRNRRGMLVHGQVPGPAGLIPAGVAGRNESRRGQDGGHGGAPRG